MSRKSLIFRASAAWALLALPGLAGADEGPRPTKTSTRAAHRALSAEDKEMAQYLELLENYELLEKWELVNAMPALEDDDAR
ncbi:MAG: hypothetical protein U1E65_13860 [Myxococcota bacterium]